MVSNWLGASIWMLLGLVGSFWFVPNMLGPHAAAAVASVSPSTGFVAELHVAFIRLVYLVACVLPVIIGFAASYKAASRPHGFG